MSELSPQRNVGPYKLLECRAEGPIASTYSAEDRASGQKVLLRILDPLVSRNAQIRAVLQGLRDPQSERRIQDPAVLRILDVGTFDGSWFVAYEDFDGVPLDRMLRQGRLPLKQALRLARLIAEGLRAVHGHRIVHGDVKPQNVLVGRSPQGRPLVKIALADLAHTATESAVSICGEIVGTPKYLSPEQIAGKRPEAASDIFALGVMFYEMFAGAEPFPADNPLGYLRTNDKACARPLCEADPSIPKNVSRVVARMLARDPYRRYRSIQAVLDDLERVEALLQGVTPQLVQPAGDSVFTAAPAVETSKVAAWRAVAVTSLVAAILLLAAVVVMTFGRGRERDEQAPVSPGPVAVESEGRTGRGIPGSDISGDSVRITVPRAASARRTEDIAAEQYESAQALLQAGQKAEALEILQTIRRDYPDSGWDALSAELMAQMMFERADVYEGRGELKKAIAALQAVTQQFPHTTAADKAQQRLPALRARLAQALTAINPDKAVAVIRDTETTGLDAADAEAVHAAKGNVLLKSAENHLEQHRFEACLKELGAAQDADPSLAKRVKQLVPLALSGLALDLKAEGKLAEAVVRWRELESKFPLSLALRRGRAEMAPLMRAAANIRSSSLNDAVILMELANHEIAANNHDAALPHLQRLVSDYPRTPSAAKARQILARRDLDEAVVLEHSGEIRKAETILAGIIDFYPSTEVAAQAREELARIRATPKEMVYVPGGTVAVGLTPERAGTVAAHYRVPKLMIRHWLGPQQPEHQVTVKPYYIDRTEVTNAQYKAFVDATGYPPPVNAAWEGKRVKPGMENHPVTHVTWRDAGTYAEWADKRLPSEAEWEHAARGNDGRIFPWGEELNLKACVTGFSGDKGTSEVGQRPEGRSPFGCDDLIGNVREWTADGYRPYPGADEEISFDVTMKVARGAGWDEEEPVFALATARYALPPNERSANLGFRCARDAE